MINDQRQTSVFFFVFFLFLFFFFFLSSIRLTRSVMFKDVIAINEKWCNQVLTRKDIIYYTKFDKGQNFNFVCRSSCLSDTKKVMIDM